MPTAATAVTAAFLRCSEGRVRTAAIFAGDAEGGEDNAAAAAAIVDSGGGGGDDETLRAASCLELPPLNVNL
jgi:hypothetical protein